VLLISAGKFIGVKALLTQMTNTECKECEGNATCCQINCGSDKGDCYDKCSAGPEGC